MPQVSIIMPAYNACDRIGRTIRSVLDQSFTDLELIVVDDGSEDNTAAAAGEYAAADARVRVLSIPNGGPSAARNAGMAAASGTYLMFIDDDDVMMPQCLGQLADDAARAGAEVVLTVFEIIDRCTGKAIDYVCENPGVFGRAELGGELGRLYIANLLNQCWAKLYRTDFIRDSGLTFSDYRFGEDRLFIFDCLRKAEKVLVSPEKTYKYYVNTNGSLVNRFYDRKFEACCALDASINSLAEQLGAQNRENRDIFAYMFIKSVVSCMVTVFSDTCPFDRRGRRAYVRGILNDEHVRSNAAVRYRQGLAGEVMRLVIRTRWIGLNLLVMRLVTVANRLLPALFIKIKHRK